MGLYMYITENDRKRFKVINFDGELNKEFQEALKYDKSLLISSYDVFTKSFWRPTKVETRYQIYHDCSPDNPAYEARYQMSGSGKREVVMAYLHGIINGVCHYEQKLNSAKKK